VDDRIRKSVELISKLTVETSDESNADLVDDRRLQFMNSKREDIPNAKTN
jgi:hypothetical protein